MTFKPTRMETAALAVVAVQLALAAFTATNGATDPVPMHFNAAGEVDRWGDRMEAAWLIAAIAGVNAVISGAMAYSLRASNPDPARRRGITIGMAIGLVTTAVVAILPAAMASPTFDPATGATVTAAAVCLVLIATGAVLGKVPPNALVGVRTPWNLSSRMAWDRSNRLAGRLFFWSGLLALPLIPFLPTTISIGAISGGTLLIAAWSVFESWRVWRADPDRRPV
ncbi:DUF1648 domain-containing protein [Caulobacter sp. SLTY]|uniref:SdpI family protein n=1 Tax=Caulobacter sp. SLTY TaxID=2683262 RepID=UPI00141306A8|nr:SdpI family protein [Caulobacter sp. SLTY]NBB17177.1 DUF1648 domain-containing protein [Caulobacter sp. SLTY]